MCVCTLFLVRFPHRIGGPATPRVGPPFTYTKRILTMTIHELAAHYASTGVAHPIDGDAIAAATRPAR
jgi:hypothetical protein